MMNTITDFWQMIWNTNTSIIVSLYADEKSQVDIRSSDENIRFSVCFSRMCLISGHYPVKLWIAEVLVFA